MARFTVERYTQTQTGRAEYKAVKIDNAWWFEANSTSEAIEKMHKIMTQSTYILKIQTESGYKPFYKATKRVDGTIAVQCDRREK